MIIVKGWNLLTIVTMNSILDVIEVLDPPLISFFFWPTRLRKHLLTSTSTSCAVFTKVTLFSIAQNALPTKISFFPVTFNPHNRKKFFSSIFMLFDISLSIFNKKWKFSKFIYFIYSFFNVDNYRRNTVYNKKTPIKC